MQFDMYLESTKVTPLNARVSYMGTTFISALIPSFIYSLSINQIWEHEFVFLWLFGQFGQYLTRLTWLIHTSFLPSKWNLYPKIQFWPKNKSEKWTRKNIFEISPCWRLLSFTTEKCPESQIPAWKDFKIIWRSPNNLDRSKIVLDLRTRH